MEDPWKREPGESGSDWTPEDFGDGSQKNRTDQKFKGDARTVTVYNVEATYFKGLDGAALLRSVARKFKSICRKLALFEFALPSSTCKLAS